MLNRLFTKAFGHTDEGSSADVVARGIPTGGSGSTSRLPALDLSPTLGETRCAFDYIDKLLSETHSEIERARWWYLEHPETDQAPISSLLAGDRDRIYQLVELLESRVSAHRAHTDMDHHPALAGSLLDLHRELTREPDDEFKT